MERPAFGLQAGMRLFDAGGRRLHLVEEERRTSLAAGARAPREVRSFRGVRHGFGLQAVSRGIALDMVQKWPGHAQLATTAIHANAVGEEERGIAAGTW